MILWGSSNFSEILPDRVSPFTESILSDVFVRAIKDQYRSYGYTLPVDSGEVIKVIQGKPYFNFTLMIRVAEECWCQDGNRLLSILGGVDLHALDQPLQKRFGALSKTKAIYRGIRAVVSGVRAIRVTQKKRRRLLSLSGLESESSGLFGCVTNSSYTELERRAQEALVRHLKISFIAAISYEIMLRNGGRHHSSDVRLKNDSKAGAREAINVSQHKELIKLVDFYRANKSTESEEFEAALKAYLDQYGHRCMYEMEIAQTRPKEDPSELMRQISLLAGREDARAIEISSALNIRSSHDAKSHVGFGGNAVFKRIRSALISRIAKYLVLERERSKDILAYEMGRVRSHIVTNSIIPLEDVFFLTRNEFLKLAQNRANVAEEFRSEIRCRQELKMMKLPEQVWTTMDGVLKTPGMRCEIRSHDTQTLKGIPVCSGSAIGAARIVRDLSDAYQLKKGDIAVVRALDSGWTPLFSLASGIVTEIGGVVSHGAIIAREFGIPTIFNVTGIIDKLSNGDRVSLDGSTGFVRIESSERTSYISEEKL